MHPVVVDHREAVDVGLFRDGAGLFEVTTALGLCGGAGRVGLLVGVVGAASRQQREDGD